MNTVKFSSYITPSVNKLYVNIQVTFLTDLVTHVCTNKQTNKQTINRMKSPHRFIICLFFPLSNISQPFFYIITIPTESLIVSFPYFFFSLCLITSYKQRELLYLVVRSNLYELASTMPESKLELDKPMHFHFLLSFPVA